MAEEKEDDINLEALLEMADAEFEQGGDAPLDEMATDADDFLRELSETEEVDETEYTDIGLADAANLVGQGVAEEASNVWEGVKAIPGIAAGVTGEIPKLNREGIARGENVISDAVGGVVDYASENPSEAIDMTARGIGKTSSIIAGAGTGATIGAAGGPFAPLTVPVGAVIGALSRS